MAIITNQQMLEAVQAKILSILQTGQEYTIVGSRSVKNPELTALVAQERKYTRRLVRANGALGRNQSDHSDGSSRFSTSDDRRG